MNITTYKLCVINRKDGTPKLELIHSSHSVAGVKSAMTNKLEHPIDLLHQDYFLSEHIITMDSSGLIFSSSCNNNALIKKHMIKILRKIIDKVVYYIDFVVKWQIQLGKTNFMFNHFHLFSYNIKKLVDESSWTYSKAALTAAELELKREQIIAELRSIEAHLIQKMGAWIAS